MRAFAKILSSIVQRVVVPVVALLSLFAAKNHATHTDCFMRLANIANGIKRVSTSIPLGLPIPLIEPVKIVSIDDSNLALCEGYESVRLIERLDCVTFHAAGINSYWHRSSSKGLLLSAAILA